jgi:hypothetical protein
MTEYGSILDFCLRVPIVCLSLIGFGLDGCAATSNIPLTHANQKAPIKILVMQSPITIDLGRLRSVMTPNISPELSASEEDLSQGVKHAQDHAFSAMESTLAKQPGLSIVTPEAREIQIIDNIQGYNLGTPISQDVADYLQKTTGADALLRFAITDYGLTPRSWRNGYIAFEVVTTLAIAAVIAYSNSIAAKAAAGTYLAQEAVEETATAYAGFWALDVVCRPVRIEAELIRLKPVATVWKTSDTGLSDVSLTRLSRKVDIEEQHRQLDQSTDYAVQNVVSGLSNLLINYKPKHY